MFNTDIEAGPLHGCNLQSRSVHRLAWRDRPESGEKKPTVSASADMADACYLEPIASSAAINICYQWNLLLISFLESIPGLNPGRKCRLDLVSTVFQHRPSLKLMSVPAFAVETIFSDCSGCLRGL
jgi:hypothetical protein